MNRRNNIIGFPSKFPYVILPLKCELKQFQSKSIHEDCLSYLIVEEQRTVYSIFFISIRQGNSFDFSLLFFANHFATLKLLKRQNYVETQTDAIIFKRSVSIFSVVTNSPQSLKSFLKQFCEI